MAKFLTTKRIALGIEELIENAQQHIYLITPYVQLSSIYHDRLKHAIKQGVVVTVIYGKEELNYKEEKLLKELNCHLYYKENLHGKCYANEKEALVTSLNLYSYSEAHNEEMGVSLDRVKDAEAYQDCIKNIHLLSENAVLKQSGIPVKEASEPTKKVELDKFEDAWFHCLNSSFAGCSFERNEKFVYAKDFIKKGIEFTTENGFATIRLNIDWELGQKLSREYYSTFAGVLSNYRFYWSSPFTKVALYPLKNLRFNNTDEEIRYRATGVTKLLSCLKSINVI